MFSWMRTALARLTGGSGPPLVSVLFEVAASQQQLVLVRSNTHSLIVLALNYYN